MRAEVLAPRRQVQVHERQINRMHWRAGDRMVLAALGIAFRVQAGPDCRGPIDRRTRPLGLLSDYRLLLVTA